MSLDAPNLVGAVNAKGFKIGIVVSRFNQDITDKLLNSALAALTEHGADQQSIVVVHVPGALEIATVAAKLAQRGIDALICLGCVIRGGTAHFDYVCATTMQAIGNLAARGDIAVGNGVLTLDSIIQAQERVGGTHGDKGREAALVAIEIAQTLKRLSA
ncbi:MAG: 6,7-dimethyl-8-ribityllumazine synthase [Mariprofundales bacterium]|nr:6,7-dimethyl-8-ribityllumazine synthase [Mariprofundales bacterium]